MGTIARLYVELFNPVNWVGDPGLSALELWEGETPTTQITPDETINTNPWILAWHDLDTSKTYHIKVVEDTSPDPYGIRALLCSLGAEGTHPFFDDWNLSDTPYEPDDSDPDRNTIYMGDDYALNRYAAANDIDWMLVDFFGPPPDIKVPDGIQLYLKSPTGETLGILSDSDQSAPSLNAKIKTIKNGGVDEFSFDVPSNFDLPITRNTICHFYVNGTLWFVGFVNEIPLPDQDNPVLTILGKGFYHRLKNKVISASYTDETFENIIKGIANTYLGADIGIYYSATLIEFPTITGLTVAYKDKDLLFIFDQLLQIANYDYDDTKYRFYIDNDGYFVFEEISEDIQKTIFEGFQYQEPEVTEENSNIINKILAFRSTSADPKEVEYVNTYQDTGSQARFGLLEKKITFPDYINDTTIANIAAFILQRRANPVDKVGINNYIIDTTLIFGKYIIANRRAYYWLLADDCDDLNDWDTSALINTTISLSSDHVLTGRQSFKFITGPGSNGEFAEITLPDVIPFPILARNFLYYASVTPLMEITYFSAEGSEVTLKFGSLEEELWLDDISIGEDQMGVDPNGSEDIVAVDLLAGSIINQWVRLTRSIELISGVEVFQVYDGITAEDFEVQYTTVDADLLFVRFVVEEGVLNVKRIRLTILTNAITTFYLDRMDIQANSYKWHRLQLEEARYRLSSVALFADMNFGEQADNVFTEIDNKVEDGDIALAIVAKQ